MFTAGTTTKVAGDNQSKLHVQLRNSLIKQLTSFSYIASSAYAETKLYLSADPFQLQVCKLMLDEILDQLKNEVEIVKKYKFQKINGLRIEGNAEMEVNELLKNAVTSVIGEGNQEIINEVIIPALLSVEK